MARRGMWLCVAIASGACALWPSDASAAVTGVRWREVDNSAATPGVNGWASGNRTFDLYVVGTSASDAISGVNAGGDGQPAYGIRIVGGVAYNTPVFGQDVRSTQLETQPGLTEIRFDSFGCYGGNPAPGGPDGQTTVFVGTRDLVGADGRITFTTFTTPNAPLTPDALAPGGFSIRVLRITVDANTTNLGDQEIDGEPSRVQVGVAGAGLASFLVPDALHPFGAPLSFALTAPAPGASCLAVSPAPTFSWGGSGFATSYDLIVATDSTFATTVYSAAGLTTTSHTPPLWTIDRGRSYAWKVIARNALGSTASTPGAAGLSAIPAGDVDQSGGVAFPDLNRTLSAFGSAPGEPAYDALADLDHDGAVDFVDLNIVLSNYGQACAP